MYSTSSMLPAARCLSNNLLRVSALLIAAQEAVAGAEERLLPRSLKTIPVWRPDDLAALARTTGNHSGHPLTA
jgi:hypothetical protein